MIGDEWYAGNLSYHLSSRPNWLNELKEKDMDIQNNQGVIYTGNPKILKKSAQEFLEQLNRWDIA